MKHHTDQPKAPEAKPMQGEMAKKEDHPQGHDMHNSSMTENKMQHARPNHHAHKAADSRVNKRRMMMTSNRNAPITPGIEPCWTAQLAAYVI